jgi:gluconolactonase
MVPLATEFEGKRLNSPNDLVYDRQGNLYFTDPPYGLPGTFEDPDKQLPFQGVYRVSKDGKLTLASPSRPTTRHYTSPIRRPACRSGRRIP